MIQGLRKFLKIFFADGPRVAVARSLGAVARKVDVRAKTDMTSKVDVSGFYRWILPPDALAKGERLLTVQEHGGEQVDVLWLIPDFGEGSGGHLNIFRFFRGLERLGLRAAVVIVGGHSHADHAAAKAKIERFFGSIQGGVYFDGDVLPRARKLVATSWVTAYFARHYQLDEVEKFYFVQDYEPWFYAAGFDADAAARTYEFGFKAICAGSWLPQIIQERHGVRALGYFGFSFDHDIYRPINKRDGIKRVFFYARPPTARRGFELGMLALDIVGRLRPDVHFIFAGWDVSNYQFDHTHLNAGIVATSELPDLYSQCDVALIISFSNMSLLPYEVMACNCAVVTNDDACAKWGLNERVATIAESSPEVLAAEICRLLDDESLRMEKVRAAREFVVETDWNREVRNVHGLLLGKDVMR